MSKPHYDFSKFPSKYPLTVKYSAISHVRGKLHMSRLRIDKFFILTGKGPEGWTQEMIFRRHPDNAYPWYMEDQEKLVAKALSETPFIQEELHADAPRQAAVSG